MPGRNVRIMLQHRVHVLHLWWVPWLDAPVNRMHQVLFNFNYFWTLPAWAIEYSMQSRSIPRQLMPWLLTSPGHQLSWYWLAMQDLQFLCSLSVYKAFHLAAFAWDTILVSSYLCQVITTHLKIGYSIFKWVALTWSTHWPLWDLNGILNH